MVKEEKEKNKNLRIKNNNLNSSLKNIETKYKEILNEKEIELNKLINENAKLKAEANREITFIKPGEKILSINFQTNDQTISNYSLPCKNTDLFVYLEEKLNQDFPQLKDKQYYMVNKGEIIKRFKTMDENKIKGNDIICIMDYSF